MRAWTWKLLICAGLLAVIVWQRVDMAKQEERYRLLKDRQDRVDKLIQTLPSIVDCALDRHRKAMMAYMEGRKDDG